MPRIFARVSVLAALAAAPASAAGPAYTVDAATTLLSGNTSWDYITLDLATLAPIARMDLQAGDLKQGVYDPATKQAHMIFGSRPAAGPDGKLSPPVFHRNSFVVMTYARGEEVPCYVGQA